MAAAPFQLPAIQQGVPVVDPKTGVMTSYFSDWLNRVLKQIQDQVNTDNNTLASLLSTQVQLLAAVATLQATQAAVAVAQATADTAGGTGAQSGFATQTLNVGLGWSMGPQVNLAGVGAGNLTLAGTGPAQGNTTTVDAGTFTGQWRIQEITPGPVETTVFSGTFTAEQSRDDQGVQFFLYNNTDTTSVSIPSVSTGLVDYRMDLQFTQPVSAFNVVANLYVRRS